MMMRRFFVSAPNRVLGEPVLVPYPDLRGCPVETSDIFKKGFAAFHDGHGLVNPYGKLTWKYLEWKRGYSYAMHQTIY